jgi:hypothetical protein
MRTTATGLVIPSNKLPYVGLSGAKKSNKRCTTPNDDPSPDGTGFLLRGTLYQYGVQVQTTATGLPFPSNKLPYVGSNLEMRRKNHGETKL